jgi:YVTN family beta-propeller protein
MAGRTAAVIHGRRDIGSLLPLRRAILALFLLSMLLLGPSYLFFIPEAHAQSLVTTIPLGSSLGGLAYDSGKGEIFVSEGSSGSVAVLSDSSDKLVTNIPVSSTPGGLAYDPSNGDVYVGTSTLQAYTISVISDTSNSVVKTIQVGYEPYGLAYDSGRGEIYVSNYASGTVSVISDGNNSVVKTINLSNVGGTVGPGGIVYDSNKGELFVADSMSGNVSVISDTTNVVVANVSVAAKPSAIAYDSGNGEVFVASSYAKQVDAISASTYSLVANLTGVDPRALAYDAARGEMFMGGANNTAPYADEVSAISDSTNRVVASLVVSSEPGYLAYDPGTGDIIAGYSGGIYVIPDSLQTISGTTTISSSVIATSSSSSPTSTETSSSSSLHLDQPQATLTYGPVTCTVVKNGSAINPCTSIDPCANGNPCFNSMSTGSATLAEGAAGNVLEGFANVNFNVTEAGSGQLQLSSILLFNTGACGIPLQGEDHWELSGVGTNFTGQYTISTPCISWTAPVTLTLAGTGLTQGTPASNSTSASASLTISTSTSSSTPTTPTPPPAAPGIGLSTIEIAGIIAGAIAVAGGLGWYYYGNSGGGSSEEGGDASCSGGTIDCNPALPVACGHATRTPVTATCLTTASGPTVQCTATGTATAQRVPATACSLAPAPCAPPGTCGAHATREVTLVCSLTPASGVPVSCPDSGTATAHRIPASPCSLATSQCTPPGTCGISSHATRDVCTVDSLTTVSGPSSSCSDAPTGQATRIPETACSIAIVTGPSVICPSSGEGTAHRCVQSVCSLARATCSQTGHATRCCSICAACAPKTHVPAACGTAVRQPVSVTACQPLSHASCAPVTCCAAAAHGTRTPVSCGCFPAGCVARVQKGPCTGTATRTPQSVQGCSVPVVQGPSVSCPSTGTAVRCTTTICAKSIPIVQCTASGSSTATMGPPICLTQPPTPCQPGFLKVKQPQNQCCSAAEEVIVAGCSAHPTVHPTVCGPCGTEEVIVAGCSAHPTVCGASTATRTPCSPQGKMKVVKQPSGSSSSSRSCSSTTEDTPPSCG